MHQFFVDPACIGGEVVFVPGDEAVHMKKSLRIRPGEKVKICDGDDNVYICTLEAYEAQEVRLKIEKKSDELRELPADIVLFQGLPKKDKMEEIIQKCVELGVHSIVPVRMHRCIVKVKGEKSEKKLERWNLIARSAAKQSGRGIIPRVLPVMDLEEAVHMAEEFDSLLVSYEMYRNMQASRETIRLIKKGMRVGVFIGPEGGFEIEEVHMLKNLGAQCLSLGNRILRTETAGAAILSVIMFQLDEGCHIM